MNGSSSYPQPTIAALPPQEGAERTEEEEKKDSSIPDTSLAAAASSASNSSALLFGAMNAGASQMTVSGSVSNYGAIHSNDDLAITAAGVTNRSTGSVDCG